MTLSSPRLACIAAIVLAVLACTLCVSTYRIFGNTWDEPEHIAAGISLIQRGEYLYDNQHPPLARLAAAVGPYLAGARIGDPSPFGEAEGRELLYHSPHSFDTLLTLARLGMLPFLALLFAACWRWMRRWFGTAEALLTLVFLLSTPVILGHAAVVALDVPVTALTVTTLYLLLRWFETPTVAAAARLGIAAGLAVATKMSAIPFIGIAALSLIAVRLLLWQRSAGVWHWRQRAAGAALASLLLLIVAIGVYGPHLVYLTTPQFAPSNALNFLVGRQGSLHDLAYRIAARVPVPFGVQMLPTNIQGVEWHNTHGHLSYLLGHTALNGWWYFYLVALAVKTPLPLLVLGVAGLSGLLWRGSRQANLYVMAPAVCFLSILVFCCLYSHINIGVRHVLIAYPLLAMGAAWALVTAWRRWQASAARAVLLLLTTWQVATLMLAYPDYLAYFNVLAGEHPERILVDSDLDWGGQDLRRLEKVLAARGVQQLAIGYKGTADLALEPLPAHTLLKPNQPVRGWVAITMLTLQENQAGYRWLSGYTPERIGQSFDLYQIP